MTLPSGTLVTVYEPNEVGHFDEALILVSDLADEPAGTLLQVYSFNGVGNYDTQLILVSDIGDLPAGSLAEVREPNGVGWFDPTLVDSTELNPVPSYVGPLDILPGALVAYSQRAMSAAKRGYALYTIKEEGGDTTQSFNSDATTGDAPVAAITTFLDGEIGNIEIWNDQSGNGSDLIPPYYDNRPQWGVIEASTKPAIGGETVSSPASLRVDASLSAGSIAVFAAIYVSALDITNSAYPWIFSDVDENDVGANLSSAASFMEVFNDPNFTEWDQDVPANVVGLHVVEWTIAADGAAELLIDGVLQALTIDGTPQGVIAASVFEMQWPYAVTGHSYWYEELIYNNTVISAPNRLAIRQNIAAYYGITLS